MIGDALKRRGDGSQALRVPGMARGLLSGLRAQPAAERAHRAVDHDHAVQKIAAARGQRVFSGKPRPSRLGGALQAIKAQRQQPRPVGRRVRYIQSGGQKARFGQRIDRRANRLQAAVRPLPAAQIGEGIAIVDVIGDPVEFVHMDARVFQRQFEQRRLDADGRFTRKALFKRIGLGAQLVPRKPRLGIIANAIILTIQQRAISFKHPVHKISSRRFKLCPL